MPQTPSFWTVLTMLEWATEFFQEKNVKSPRLSIEWLLAHVLSVKRLDLYMKYDRPLTDTELQSLRPLVKRRANHEPLQYITGETDFMHATLKVGPGVLIPRQETEQLVELILQRHHEIEYDVLDIGTGSGCIPISLKMERPEWKLTATDISVDALTIAQANAKLNQVSVDFIQDDILKPASISTVRKFDLIISNPPYILPDEKKSLDHEVVLYEPGSALFCDSTAKIYGAIERFAAAHLKENGRLYLELHEQHADEVLLLFSSKKWQAELINDLDEKPRFLVAADN